MTCTQKIIRHKRKKWKKIPINENTKVPLNLRDGFVFVAFSQAGMECELDFLSRDLAFCPGSIIT